MTSSETEATQAWCLFKSDARPFAVGLDSVAEVVEAGRLVRLSLCPSRVLGLCAVRRDVVPIISLTGREAAEGRDPGARPVLLILRSASGAWGIRIDREGTVVVDGPLEESAPSDGTDGLAVVGTVRRGDSAHVAIDPDRTWREVRGSVEDWYKNT